MKILKYPDFSKWESEAIISDGIRKHRIIVRVEDYSPTHVDFAEKCIIIGKAPSVGDGKIFLSTEKKRILFHHEVEHLDKKKLAPIWFLSLTEYRRAFATDENFQRIIEEAISRIENLKTKTIFLAFLLTYPNTFDNLIEDFFINKHLIKDHNFPKSAIRELGAITSDRKFLINYLRMFDKIFGNYKTICNLINNKLMHKLIMSKAFSTGFFINFIGDLNHCYTKKIKLTSFYENAVKELADFEDEFSPNNIFDEALFYKFEMEKFRIHFLNYFVQVLKENSSIPPWLLIRRLIKSYPGLWKHKNMLNEIVNRLCLPFLNSMFLDLL